MLETRFKDNFVNIHVIYTMDILSKQEYLDVV